MRSRDGKKEGGHHEQGRKDRPRASMPDTGPRGSRTSEVFAHRCVPLQIDVHAQVHVRGARDA